MGTRGLCGFVVDGDVKAAYNHFDSYPSGLGVEVLTWARYADLDDVTARARALRMVDEDSEPSDDDIRHLEHLAALRARRDVSDWYVLMREAQGDLDAYLRAGVMLDGADFAQDSLFCEWAYLVNLDDRTLEVYRGFQTEPHERGRFASQDAHTAGYAPVALLRTYALGALPGDDEFVDELAVLAAADRA